MESKLEILENQIILMSFSRGEIVRKRSSCTWIILGFARHHRERRIDCDGKGRTSTCPVHVNCHVRVSMTPVAELKLDAPPPEDICWIRC